MNFVKCNNSLQLPQNPAAGVYLEPSETMSYSQFCF